MGGDDPDLGVDRIAVGDDRFDQLAGEGGGGLVALRLGQVALEDRFRGALPDD